MDVGSDLASSATDRGRGGPGCRRKTARGRPGHGKALKDFPFWSKSLPAPEVMFANLKAVQSDGGSELVRTYPSDHRAADGISNHFTERPRIQARFGHHVSPFEQFQRLAAAGRLAGSAEEQREQVYDAGRECNLFNPAFAVWLLRRFGGEKLRVLDLSAGWGDRAVAAAAAGAECYHGTDPNPALQEGYTALSGFLASAAPDTEVALAGDPAEDYAPPREAYDVAILSPPFFDLEKYSDDCRQSIVKYQSYNSWLDKFLQPYLEKACEFVRGDRARRGGVVITYTQNLRPSRGSEGKPISDDTEKCMLKFGFELAEVCRFGVDCGCGAEKIRRRSAVVWVRRPRS